ncbi:hypothetical protein LCGC14_1155950 [marine sediment metagenome]|uniref:Uncharacterized protein n=1 Tax=marine sediment metagenome TaxID=412755 RepID=A0A0F9PCA8_9ZZZZ
MSMSQKEEGPKPERKRLFEVKKGEGPKPCRKNFFTEVVEDARELTEEEKAVQSERERPLTKKERKEMWERYEQESLERRRKFAEKFPERIPGYPEYLNSEDS